METLKLNELLSSQEKRLYVAERIIDVIAQDCNEEIIKKNCHVGTDLDGTVMVSITNIGVPSFRKFKSFKTYIGADGSLISKFWGTNYNTNYIELMSSPESGISIDVSGKYVSGYILRLLKMLKCELNYSHIRITDDDAIDDIRYVLKDRSFNAELTDRLMRRGCLVSTNGTELWLRSDRVIMSLSFNKKSPSIRIRANGDDDVRHAIAVIDYVCEFCHSLVMWVREHDKIINEYMKGESYFSNITENMANSVFSNQAFSQKIVINDADVDYYKSAMFHSVRLSEDNVIDITTALSSQSIDMNVVDCSVFNHLKISGTMSKAKIVTSNGYDLINRQLQAFDNSMKMPSEHSHQLPSLQNINRMLKNKHSREKIAECAKTLFDTDDVRATENVFHLVIMNPGERRTPYKNSLLITFLSETEALLEWNIHGRIKNMNLWRFFDKINHGM